MFSDQAKQEQTSMGHQRLAGPKGLSKVLLLASLIALAPLTVAAQQITSGVKLSGKVSYARTSPPASGVHLLEDIFQRVRSAPQIAMAKNLYKQQMEVAQQQNGPTDYRLAIRPKKLSGRNSARPLPASQMAPTEVDSLAVAFGNSGTSGTFSQRIAAEPIPQTFLGNRQFPIVAKESSNKLSSSSGVWESPAQMREEAKRESEGYSSSYRPPDLATAAGKLLGITKAIQDAQQMASSGADGWAQGGAGAPMASPSRARADQISFQSIDSKDSDDFEERVGKKNADPSVLSRRLSSKADSAVHTKMRAAVPSTNMGRFVGSAAPASPPSAFLAGGDKGTPEDGPSVSDERMIKSKIAMSDIALLPPNVVTGIPLVRLGASEMQANSALHQIGNMKQQKVNKWTVWSWNRPQSKTATSMQLFMRNGLLDAMRIFEPSLIGSDFGVSLGDSLARVKEKFGEPAFILQEAGPGAGQNYIYPISQIGFQLARPAPGQQPRVVSVLIFNVK